MTVSLSLYAWVPQASRTLRTRTTEGLSATSLGLVLTCCAFWLVYGLGISDVAQIVNNVGAMLLVGVIAWVVASQRQGLARLWPCLVVAASASVAVGASSMWGPAAAASIGGAIGTVSRFPQVWVALSGRSLLGLDPWAVVLGLVSGLLWTSYGVLAGDVPVVATSVLGVALQAVIVYRRLPLRRTLHSLSTGRLGRRVAAAAGPLATRLPYQPPVLVTA